MTTSLVAAVEANLNDLLPAQMNQRALLERMERCVECLDESRKVDWEDRERYLMELQVAVVRLAGKAHQDIEFSDDHAGSESAVPVDLLQRMRRPLEVQLRDLRSAIVREACKLLSVCVDCLQMHFAKTAAALVPVMLDLVASGNKVIAGHIDQCCGHIFKMLRLPSVLPRLISLLGNSKSKDVREASMAYLHTCLCSWTTRSLERHVDLLEGVLPRVLQDASPTVRAKARESFLFFRAHFAERAKSILMRADERTQRSLQKAMQNHAVEISPGTPASPKPRTTRSRGASASSSGWSPRSSTVSTPASSPEVSKRLSLSQRSRHSESKLASEPRPRTAPRSQESLSSHHTQPGPSGKWEGERGRLSEPMAASESMTSFSRPLVEQAPARPPSKPAHETSEASMDIGAAAIHVDLPALVAAHRAHLNEVIASVAEELKVLKRYEKIVRAERQNETGRVDPRPYVEALYSHLQEKERQLASLRSDFDAVLSAK